MSAERTVRMPDKSLNFNGGAGRGPGIPALPPPPSRPAPAPPAPDPVPAAQAAAPSRAAQVRAQAETAPAARPRRRKASRAAGVDEGTGVYLPFALVADLRAFARENPGRTYTDITLDAIEANHERLAALVAPVAPPRSGPLFAGRQPRKIRHDEPHQQVNLRFSPEDLKVVDDLTVEHRAPNRSALLAAALRAYLPRHD